MELLFLFFRHYFVGQPVTVLQNVSLFSVFTGFAMGKYNSYSVKDKFNEGKAIPLMGWYKKKLLWGTAHLATPSLMQPHDFISTWGKMLGERTSR